MPLTPAQLIETKGGPAAFAAAIRVEPSAARMMKHRNKLPRAVWPEIQKAYDDITLDQLLEIEAASLNAGPSSAATPAEATA